MEKELLDPILVLIFLFACSFEKCTCPEVVLEYTERGSSRTLPRLEVTVHWVCVQVIQLLKHYGMHMNNYKERVSLAHALYSVLNMNRPEHFLAPSLVW